MAQLEPFESFCSVGVPIDIANCDTDQLLPARFLRLSTDDPDYGRFLLHDLRFHEDGSAKEFIYNKTPYCDGRIFVTDINWGCGSSREVAVNGLTANGVRAVIAPSFGDIHYANCIKNGLLPVRLTAEQCQTIRGQLHDAPGATITIDLVAQTVVGPDQTLYHFDIEAFNRHRLLHGLDDIGLTRQYDDQISSFINRYRARHRWAAPD